MDNDDLRFAMEDAREGVARLLWIVETNDQRAMALLRLYVSLALAGVAAAASVYQYGPATASGMAVMAGLIAAVVLLILGGWWAARAQVPATMTLPGATPAFWLKRVDAEQADMRAAALEYLEAMRDGQRVNKEINRHGARLLRRAKLAGALAAPVGVAAAATVWLLAGLSVAAV